MNSKSVGKRRRHVITLQLKQEIIAKHENGMKIAALTKLYGFPQSTISTIIKSKAVLKHLKVTDDSTKVFKSRATIVEMERLLLIWINEKQMKGEYLSQELICRKARAIFEDLRAKTPTTSDSVDEFKASKGWFDRFRKRAARKSVMQYGESYPSDKAADTFKREFLEYVEAEGYLPQQVFNVNETGLFWKKMPRKTFLTKEEAKLPGHKPMKDRLTLLLGGNASGDFKLKPLLVYHSETPRVFRQHKIVKSNLGVCWKSNQKARVTRVIFNEWVHDVFCPSIQVYLDRHKLPKAALLVLDNAPGHDPDLAMILETKFDFIKVKFFPPNTTSLLQPMDQQVITNFKKLYTKRLFKRCFDATFAEKNVSLCEFWRHQFSILDAIRLIVSAWSDVSIYTMNSAWRTLWPQVVHDFESFQETEFVEKDIVTLGLSMGLEVDEDDVEDLVEEHSRDLNTEELLALQEMQAQEQDSGEDKDDDTHEVSAEVLKEGLKGWNAVKTLLQYHPDIAECELMSCQFEDRVMSYFRKLQSNRQKKNHFDNLFTSFTSTAVTDSPPPVKKKREMTPANTDILMEYDPVIKHSPIYHNQLYQQPPMHYSLFNKDCNINQ